MIYESKYWSSKLDELETRVTSVKKVNRNILYDWVAECVATFSHLGVGNDIIRGFMNLFEGTVGLGDQKWYALFQQWMEDSRQHDRIKGFYYTNIAFTTARALIFNLEEQERIVPKRLIELLKTKSEYSNITTSLESIVSADESKDVQNILSATSALLQSIIKLHTDPVLSKMQKLKNQLSYILKNKSILDDFGGDEDLIEILHTFRHLRNKTSQHKVPSNPKISSFVPPMSVGQGFTSLVLLLLYAVISRGAIIDI